jgi:hypothetical protein
MEEISGLGCLWIPKGSAREAGRNRGKERPFPYCKDSQALHHSRDDSLKLVASGLFPLCQERETL